MPPQPPQAAAASAASAASAAPAAPADEYDYASNADDGEIEPLEDPDDVAEEDADDSDAEALAPPMKKMALGSPEAEEQGKGFMAVKPWVGAIVEPSSPPALNPAPPAQKLELEWAYGYRCFDSRSNVFSNKRGQVVYPLASLVVVYSKQKHAQSYFRGHSDDVRCLAQNPAERDWMASGQNATIVEGRSTAPHVCVWNSTDFAQCVTLPLPSSARAVRTVAFSPDGKFVACATNDDSHTVYLWEWRSKRLLASKKGDNNPILQLKFNHLQPSKDAYEFATSGTKHLMIWIWDSKSSTLKSKRIALGGAFPTQTYYSVTFSEKGHVCAGGLNGDILICKAGTGAASKALPSYEGNPAKKPKVLSLDTYQGGIVAGLSDKTLVVFDEKMQAVKRFVFPYKVCAVSVHNKDLIVGTMGASIYELKNGLDASVAGGSVEGRFQPLTSGHFDGELWALAVLKDSQRALTAGEDNTLHLWDLEQRVLLASTQINPEAKPSGTRVRKAATTSLHPPPQCARALAVSPSQTQLAVGTNDGCLSLFSLPALQLQQRLDLNKYGQRQVSNQRENWIQTMEYSPSGALLAVGTHGSAIVLLDVSDPSNAVVKGVIKSHRSFLTHMDFSADGTLLRSTDGAYEVLFHSVEDAANPRHLTSASSLRDTVWHSTHCPFTWGSLGVFELEDGSSVNSLDRSPDGSLLVSGDDLGGVNLYRYPVPEKGQGRRVAKGHSSHVTSVRFTPDGKRVLTTGGHDCALMCWKVVGAAEGSSSASASSSSSAAKKPASGGDDFTL